MNPTSTDQHALCYDGEYVLSHQSVQLPIRFDRKARRYHAALQSETARRLLGDLFPEDLMSASTLHDQPKSSLGVANNDWVRHTPGCA